LCFLHERKELPFSSAEALTLSYGNALINAEAKLLSLFKLVNKNKPNLVDTTKLKQSNTLLGIKALAFKLINALPLDAHRNLCRAFGEKTFSVKKTQLSERSEF
jgi:hypothetical protein